MLIQIYLFRSICLKWLLNAISSTEYCTSHWKCRQLSYDWMNRNLHLCGDLLDVIGIKLNNEVRSKCMVNRKSAETRIQLLLYSILCSIDVVVHRSKQTIDHINSLWFSRTVRQCANERMSNKVRCPIKVSYKCIWLL